MKKGKYRLDNDSENNLQFVLIHFFCNIAVPFVSTGNTKVRGEENLLLLGFCTLFVSEPHPYGLKDRTMVTTKRPNH